MTQPLPLFIDGIGLLGPGLPNWDAAQPVLRGEAAHAFAATTLAPPARLPPAERRRSGAVMRLAMGVADEAIAHAGADPSQLATVFSSSGGEGANCHSLCEALAVPNPLISPTRFTNSVHNAAAGYWHIAVGSQATSTSLCAHDGSLCAGLLEAAAAMHSDGHAVLLVAYDLPYPEPLNSSRPIPENFGVALLLSPQRSGKSLAALQAQPVAAQPGAATRCDDASLEALRTAIPAAAALPLLQLLARRSAGTLVLDYLDGLQVRVHVESL
ncbi:beta-ketoacyl synthase chain length factor [Pseudorhodoferax sp. Leaf267]|uniref:beta-ketoacyl synthase chain length factor n=1 Tax=Pseudorhodoferax sp. Leaf267 TaxID=1736316 RepID=UPI0006FC3BD3|nr:beta-ketoacyl synthase chain length factor [Pseudorhodoferax sp. Leaf267]KQP11850.1 3-oxoacyl-ACP synthase [Pseudorhodoferax sp. Leaf267]